MIRTNWTIRGIAVVCPVVIFGFKKCKQVHIFVFDCTAVFVCLLVLSSTKKRQKYWPQNWNEESKVITKVLYKKPQLKKKDQNLSAIATKMEKIFIFCPKIQLWFPEKIVDFFVGWKLVKMLWFWAFSLLTT